MGLAMSSDNCQSGRIQSCKAVVVAIIITSHNLQYPYFRCFEISPNLIFSSQAYVFTISNYYFHKYFHEALSIRPCKSMPFCR